MNADPFWRALSFVLKEEGGLSLDRHDKGNWTGGRIGVGVLKGTKYGIAASSYPDLDIRHLTVEQAGAIYRKDYWLSCGCSALPAGVDLVIFDAAVNSGVGRALRFRDATAAITSPVERIKAISERRRAFYQGLAAFARYGRAWLDRVARIEASAVRLALNAHDPALVKATLRREARAAAGGADRMRGAAAIAGSSTVVASLWGAPDPAFLEPAAAPQTVLMIVALIGVGVGLTLWLAHRARAQRVLAAAYAAAAE